jgi:hypothetical protein
MSHYLIEFDIDLEDDTPAEAIEELFDALAAEVADLGDGIDGDVSANISSRTVTIHLSLDDERDETAFARGIAAARTAVHAAGIGTPGWEKVTLQPVPSDLAPC